MKHHIFSSISDRPIMCGSHVYMWWRRSQWQGPDYDVRVKLCQEIPSSCFLADRIRGLQNEKDRLMDKERMNGQELQKKQSIVVQLEKVGSNTACKYYYFSSASIPSLSFTVKR